MTLEFENAAPMPRDLPWPTRRGDPDSDVARARKGDHAAFARIVRAHEQHIYRLACRLLGNREDAKDAAQETFIRCYRFLDRYDPRRPLSTWLYAIAVNVCHDTARRRKRHRAQPLDGRDAQAVPSAADSERTAQSKETRAILEAGLRTLPEKERAAVVLRDIEGLSTKDVARVLGSSPMTVRSQISRARVKLREYHRRIVENGEQL